MLNIVLFGPPGAGKGTQAAKISAKYGITHISTGEIIREEIIKGTPLGLEAAGYIEKGHLAPDSLIIDMMKGYIEAHRHGKGILFDGFPRTVAQAEALDTMLGSINERIALMVSLDVPDNELILRITLRSQYSGRSDDMDVAVITNRISVYKSQTAIVADYYAARGKYFPVKGTGTVDEVFEAVCEKINSAINV